MSQPSSSKFKTIFSRVIHNTFTSSKVFFPSAIPALQSLLTLVDQYPALYTNRHVLSNAIRRYERLWLPLMFSNSGVTLMPPIDVHWVWICHMLCPVVYALDLQRVRKANSSHVADHSAIVDHALLRGSDRLLAMSEAEKRWVAAYPDEQFDLQSMISQAPMFASSDDPDDSHLPSHITYDIVAAASRQMAFHYQVCNMPQYFNLSFRQKAVKRYLNGFLRLKKLYPNTVISPTYDIDLVWHCHMLHPVLYAKETVQITGFLLPHDDSINDRTPGSSLNIAWDNTTALWIKNISKNGPAVPGGMFRGIVTAEERALRPAIQASKTVIESQYGSIAQGKLLFSVSHSELWKKKAQISRASSDVQWLHLGAAGILDQQSSSLMIERYTEMTPYHNSSSLPKLACTATHCVTNCQEGKTKYQKVGSAIEIQSQGDEYLPLATAHLLNKWNGAAHLLSRPSKENRVLSKCECEFLLRIAGEDAAILVGRWTGFKEPVPGSSGIPLGRPGILGARGEEGKLQLHILALNTGVAHAENKAEWETAKRHTSNPGQYTFGISQFAGCDEDDRVIVSLTEGRIWCSNSKHAVLGYLLGMTSAMISVILQPRYEPSESGGSNSVPSWYPVWGTKQVGYEMLEGAGGEMENKGTRDSYGGLEKTCVGSRAFVGNVDAYRPRAMWDPVRKKYLPFEVSGGCGGCGGCGGGGGATGGGCGAGTPRYIVYPPDGGGHIIRPPAP